MDCAQVFDEKVTESVLGLTNVSVSKMPVSVDICVSMFSVQMKDLDLKC